MDKQPNDSVAGLGTTNGRALPLQSSPYLASQSWWAWSVLVDQQSSPSDPCNFNLSISNFPISIMIGLVSPRKINNLHLLIRCRRWTDKVPVGASVSGGFSPFSPTPPSLSKRKKVCTANSLLLLSGRLRREDLTSSDWDTWSPTTASSSQASCSSCSWSSSPQDLPLGHSMEWQMADVSSF